MSLPPDPATDGTGAPLLSICIATLNRAGFIAATLEAIAPQLDVDVEVVIVDGASRDATPEVIAAFLAAHPGPAWRYFREDHNGGVDADYDKAIVYAAGRYCWLLPDDDLPRPDAVATLKRALADEPDVVAVNARFMSPDLREVLDAPRLKADADRYYCDEEIDEFITQTIFYLTYIGGCVVRRAFWLERERSRYFGTGFVHLGVICQAPLPARARLIAAPLIDYRHGNAAWRPQAFDIWMLGWPRLVAAFTAISPRARLAAHDPSPRRSFELLAYHLAIGSRLDEVRWQRFLFTTRLGPFRPLAHLLHALPDGLTNFLLCLYASLFMRQMLVVCYDLFTSPNAGAASWQLARLARLPTPLLRAVATARDTPRPTH